VNSGGPPHFVKHAMGRNATRKKSAAPIAISEAAVWNGRKGTAGTGGTCRLHWQPKNAHNTPAGSVGFTAIKMPELQIHSHQSGVESGCTSSPGPKHIRTLHFQSNS